MNVKKTLATVVVWYNPTTGKVSLAKCRVTGKFVSLSVAQGLLNVEMNKFIVPTVDTVKLNCSFLAMLMFVVATLFALLIPAFAGLAVISAEESIEVRV